MWWNRIETTLHPDSPISAITQRQRLTVHGVHGVHGFSFFLHSRRIETSRRGEKIKCIFHVRHVRHVRTAAAPPWVASLCTNALPYSYARECYERGVCSLTLSAASKRRLRTECSDIRQVPDMGNLTTGSNSVQSQGGYSKIASQPVP